MDGFGVVNDDMSIPLRRPSRAERSIDDPIREMEGMVVDEYGRFTSCSLDNVFLCFCFLIVLLA